MNNYNQNYEREIKNLISKHREELLEYVVKNTPHYDEAVNSEEDFFTIISLLLDDFMRKVSEHLLTNYKTFYEFRVKEQNLKDYCKDNGITQEEFLEIAQKSLQSGRYAPGFDKLESDIDLEKLYKID